MCEPASLAAVGSAIWGGITAAGSAVASGVAAVGSAAVTAGSFVGANAGTIGSVAGLLGSGISAYGQYKTGQAQKAASEYQAKVNQNNSIIAHQNAAMERQAGLEEQRRQKIKVLSAVGQQKTAMAANGLDINDAGTATDIISDTAQMGELDILTLGYNSEKRALAYEQQSNDFTNQSNLNLLSAKNAGTSGLIGATGSALGGLGKVSSQWSKYGSSSKGTTGFDYSYA